jgi:ubiquinone/menaquinone biosynthesis C-methylase UbiE
MSLRTTFFALTYDRQMTGTERAGLRAFRERLLAGAHGDVLEIGGGTGANLPCYGPDVRSLTITEPQPAMLRRLQRRIGEHRPSARVLRAPAEDLPFDDHSFDVAVSTLVLCGVDDQPRALRELRRVLRPGGQLLLIEHLRSRDPACARLQDRMNWLNRLVVCCDCNRPTLDSIRQAGFTVDQLEHTALPKTPKFVAPAILGAARLTPASARLGRYPRRAGWPSALRSIQKKLFRTAVARRPQPAITRLRRSENMTLRTTIALDNYDSLVGHGPAQPSAAPGCGSSPAAAAKARNAAITGSC